MGLLLIYENNLRQILSIQIMFDLHRQLNNNDFLSDVQQKQMSFQPDMILEYGQYLGNHFKNQGHQNVAVYVESYVSLNGRLSQQFIDPSANLMDLKDTFKHKYWINPLKDEIKGF